MDPLKAVFPPPVLRRPSSGDSGPALGAGAGAVDNLGGGELDGTRRKHSSLADTARLPAASGVATYVSDRRPSGPGKMSGT